MTYTIMLISNIEPGFQENIQTLSTFFPREMRNVSPG